MYLLVKESKRSERMKQDLMTQGLEISVYRVFDLLIDVHHLRF